MKPEINSFLKKASECLSNGRANLSIGLSNDAGRNAYLTAFHTAQAYIFLKSGKMAKTHQGVHSLFSQMAAKDKRIPKDLQIFISQAYDLKAVADYEAGPDSIIPIERSMLAIQDAERFYVYLKTIIEEDNSDIIK